MRRRIAWGYSSAGRALEWHSRGQRFDPAYLHHPNGRGFRLSRFFFLCRVSPAASVAEQGGKGSPLPFPRLPPRPTRPKAARPPAKRRRSRHLCASVGMGAQRTAGSARRAVRPPSFPSQCASSIPQLSRRTPQKNSPAGSALFHAVIRCALLLTTTTAAASPTAKTLEPDVGAQRHRAADALSRRQFPQNRASECPFAQTHPRQNGCTQAACQKRIRLPAKHIKP